MMTKQEVKDEFKDSEGDPQVKGQIRTKNAGDFKETYDAAASGGGCCNYEPDAFCSGIKI